MPRQVLIKVVNGLLAEGREFEPPRARHFPKVPPGHMGGRERDG